MFCLICVFGWCFIWTMLYLHCFKNVYFGLFPAFPVLKLVRMVVAYVGDMFKNIDKLCNKLNKEL